MTCISPGYFVVEVINKYDIGGLCFLWLTLFLVQIAARNAFIFSAALYKHLRLYLTL